MDGSELMEACKETFGHRHTSFDDIVAFEDDYASAPVRQSRWKSFAKKIMKTWKHDSKSW